MKYHTSKMVNIANIPAEFTHEDVLAICEFYSKYESRRVEVHNGIRFAIFSQSEEFARKFQERFLAFKEGYKLAKKKYTTKDCHTLCVRTEPGMLRTVQIAIMDFDSLAEYENEGNDVTFWVRTCLSHSQVANLKGVLDCIKSEFS